MNERVMGEQAADNQPQFLMDNEHNLFWAKDGIGTDPLPQALLGKDSFASSNGEDLRRPTRPY